MYNGYPFMANVARGGLLGRGAGFFRGINWGGLLDGTQKTLGVINQAIPIVYQVKPVLNNAKTMFKIAGELRGNNQSSQNNLNNNQSLVSPSIKPTSLENKPIFYL